VYKSKLGTTVHAVCMHDKLSVKCTLAQLVAWQVCSDYAHDTEECQQQS
jgi:hypothetical protein